MKDGPFAGCAYNLCKVVLTGLGKQDMGAKGSKSAKGGCNCGGGREEIVAEPLPTPISYSAHLPTPIPYLVPLPEPEVLKDLPASEMFGLAFQRVNEKRAAYGVPPVDLILGLATEEAFENAAAIAEAFRQTGCKQLTRSANANAGLVGQNIYAITLGGMTYDTSTLTELMAVAIDMWDEDGTPEFRELVLEYHREVAFGAAVADCGDGRSPWFIFIANFMSPPPDKD